MKYITSYPINSRGNRLPALLVVAFIAVLFTAAPALAQGVVLGFSYSSTPVTVTGHIDYAEDSSRVLLVAHRYWGGHPAHYGKRHGHFSRHYGHYGKRYGHFSRHYGHYGEHPGHFYKKPGHHGRFDRHFGKQDRHFRSDDHGFRGKNRSFDGNHRRFDQRRGR